MSKVFCSYKTAHKTAIYYEKTTFMANTIKAKYDRYQYHEVCRTKSIRVVTNPFPDPDPYQMPRTGSGSLTALDGSASLRNV